MCIRRVDTRPYAHPWVQTVRRRSFPDRNQAQARCLGYRSFSHPGYISGDIEGQMLQFMLGEIGGPVGIGKHAGTIPGPCFAC